MLRLLIGTDWTVNRDDILSCVSADVRKGLGGRILIVPELVSHDMERRLCAAAGDSVSRFAEVLSFSRLAGRIAESVGSAACACLDNGGRVVAMAAAARQLSSKLKAYASVETNPDFLSALIESVDEFKRCCVSSEDLKSAAQQTEGSLSQKLEELSLLLEMYDSLCQNGKRDPWDQMTWLLEQLEGSRYGAEHTFYIDGFPDFTRQHMEIVEHLIRSSPSVTVSLTCDRVDSDAMAFEKAGSTAAELLRFARKEGIQAEVIRLDAPQSDLRTVSTHLFQGRIEPLAAEQTCLRVYSADSAYAECMAAAQRITELVRQGCRYRDIAVVCTDMAVYRPILSLVFKRCGIPAYLSGTEDILQRPVVATVLSALDAALGSMEQKEILRYFKSVLSPLTPDVCDRIENYAILWGIRGNRWNETWVNHPDGLDGKWEGDAQERLDSLNSFRALAMEPLVKLRKGFRDAVSLAEQVRCVYDFLEDLHFAERLNEMAEELDHAGDNREAQILNQLWEIILSALEQMYDVLGKTVWDAEAFSRLFQLLLSQYDVGTIPPVLDAVTVGKVAAMQCSQERHLIVLGAEEGKLPTYGSASGVLTEQERHALRGMGMPLNGGAMEQLQGEFSEIYGVFCGAAETAAVYASGDAASFVYRRLAQLAGGERSVPALIGPALSDQWEAGAYLAGFNAGDTAASLGVEEAYGAVVKMRDYGFGKIGQEAVHALYGNQLRLSASKVDRLAECRLAYFLQYGLKAKERKEADVDPSEFGTYVHAVLEKTCRRVRELGGFHKVSLEDTMAIAEEYGQEYAKERFSQLDSERTEYLFRRNKQELDLIVRELWEELSLAQFEPVGFEVQFRDGEQMPSVLIRGQNMQARLEGIVDRIDTWEHAGGHYYRVVDYKTGKKDFVYCDVFNGIGLQMLLYLFALRKGGEKVVGDHGIPAAVQYFLARVPYLSEDGSVDDEAAHSERMKEWKRVGLVLENEDVIRAIDPTEGFSRIKCKRNKDGEWKDGTADCTQLKLLEEYVFHVLGKLVDEIASGEVAPNPYTRGAAHNACSFCPYGTVCHEATVEGRRNYREMTPQRFWEEIGKELSHRG